MDIQVFKMDIKQEKTRPEEYIKQTRSLLSIVGSRTYIITICSTVLNKYPIIQYINTLQLKYDYHMVKLEKFENQKFRWVLVIHVVDIAMTKLYIPIPNR